MSKIIVKDMNCMHCFQTIQKGLIKESIIAEIDLSKKEVKVSEKDLERSLEIIKDLGFSPQV